GQQTADPAEALSKSHGWDHKIKICQEVQFLYPAVQPSCQNAADNSSVYHKSVADSVQHESRVSHKLFPFRDPEKELGAEHPSHQAPHDQIKNMLVLHFHFFCPVFRRDPRRHHAHGDHQAVSVYGERTNLKQFILHYISSYYQYLSDSFSSFLFAASLHLPSITESRSHSPQTSIPSTA